MRTLRTAGHVLSLGFTPRFIILIVAVSPHTVGAAAATLSVHVREKGSHVPLPCRAWVDSGGTRIFQPIGSACTPCKKDRSFSCDGRFTIEVPAGRAVVHIERGKEYVPIEEAIIAEEGRTVSIAITLRRWTDMLKKGWHSADLHVHFINTDQPATSPARYADGLSIFRQMALADDVHFVPVMGYWNSNHEKWPTWPHGPRVSLDDTHLVTFANQEIERIAGRASPAFTSLGAPLFFGLARPVYAPRLETTWPCDAALCRIARKVSPDCVIDTDKALWSENVVGVALGLFDSVQLCHNHYHRDRTLDIGWGMIDADLDHVGGGSDAGGMLPRNNQVYYRWLNCGFRLAVTGGSAIGVMPVALGYNRTYARLDGALTEQNYLRAIRAGRTFATTGPMLILTVNGQNVGATIDCRSRESVSLRVRAELQSIQKIESLDVIHDGRIARRIDLSGEDPSPVLNRTIEMTLAPVRSGWVAARACFRVADGSLHQAHTSPVYFTLDGKPVAVRSDAEYMIRWIDRIMRISDDPARYSSPEDRRSTQAIFREARTVYESIARTARDTWGD